MKKLLVLSVLLGLMALPMFASDITFGGDATFGFISDFSGDAVGYAEKMDLTFDIMAAIDDYNSLTINVDGAETLALSGISKALVTTDLGAWLDLPVGVKINWGYDDPDWNVFAAISSYDDYSIYLSPDEYWGMDFLISYNMLEFELAMNPGAKNVATDYGYLLAGVAVKEPIPGLNAEFYYFQGSGADPNVTALDAYDQGMIAFDAAYATEVAGFAITAAPGFAYYMADTAPSAYKWYLALKGVYSMFAVDMELTGDETDAFANMDAVVKVSPVDKVDIYGGMQLSFRDGTDTFQGADIGVNPKMGATNAYIGYVITSIGAASAMLNADVTSPYVTPTDGGFYIKFDVNY
jgi:hypothetical protein